MIDVKAYYDEENGVLVNIENMTGSLEDVILESMGILKAIYTAVLESDKGAAAYFRWCMTVGVSIPYLEGEDLSKYVKELFDLDIYKGGDD